MCFSLSVLYVSHILLLYLIFFNNDMKLCYDLWLGAPSLKSMNMKMQFFRQCLDGKGMKGKLFKKLSRLITC